MPQDIRYSDGSTVKNAVIVVWPDYGSGSAGKRWRAFWADSPSGSTGSPVIGRCSPGGCHKTAKAAALEAVRFHPGESVWLGGDNPRRIV